MRNEDSKEVRPGPVLSAAEFLELCEAKGGEVTSLGPVAILYDTGSVERGNGQEALLAEAAASYAAPLILAITGTGTVPVTLVEACDICLADEAVVFEAVGRMLSAKEAVAEGFVNQAVEEGVSAVAEAMVREMRNHAPKALEACKRAVREGVRMELEAGLKLESALFAGMFATCDMREGTSAFLEKRNPQFTGE